MIFLNASSSRKITKLKVQKPVIDLAFDITAMLFAANRHLDVTTTIVQIVALKGEAAEVEDLVQVRIANVSTSIIVNA
jgi:hypothetical protein